MKKEINVSLAALMLLAISCTKEPFLNLKGASAQTQDNAAAPAIRHFIGERFGGGVIFYIDSTRRHGYIADTVDLPQAAWWNGTYTVTGATATNIGAGKLNTPQIVLSQGATGSYAALECSTSTRGGYTDWFLPSKDELNALYLKRTKVGVFTNYFYWTSSEGNSELAWVLHFDTGLQDYNHKYGPGTVRAIRAF